MIEEKHVNVVVGMSRPSTAIQKSAILEIT